MLTERRENGTVVKLMETLDNSTGTNSLQLITQTTTDDNGFWSFTANPTNSGTHYYYLQDTSTGQYTYLQSYTVSGATATPTVPPTTTDNTLMYAAIAVVAIIIVVAVVVIFLRSRHK